MSATIQQTAVRRAPATVGARVSLAITHTLLVTQRNLVTLIRVPTVFIFELVQPVMFVLLFRYIYANQLRTLPPGLDYVSFLMPGIFVQNAIFGSTTTAIGLAEDMKKGIVDRFRSLPMARSAVLVGRTTSDLAKNLILVLLVIGVGYLVGFRFHNGPVGAIAMILVVLAVGFVFSWISATVGLAIKEVEGVQAALFTGIFPIVFISSALVPVQGMISWIQPVAERNPVTIWANCARVLALGNVALPTDRATHTIPTTTLGGLLLWSAIWIVGLLVVFVPVAIRMYRRLT
jgi:ABC transporter DrrB family efflux protein